MYTKSDARRAEVYTECVRIDVGQVRSCGAGVYVWDKPSNLNAFPVCTGLYRALNATQNDNKQTQAVLQAAC